MAMFLHHGGAYRVGLTADITVMFISVGPGPGYLYTEDERVIKALRESSHGSIEEVIEDVKTAPSGTMTIHELRKLARAQGVPEVMKKSKEELVNLLAAE